MAPIVIVIVAEPGGDLLAGALEKTALLAAATVTIALAAFAPAVIL
jgi:hypothetical protein